MSRNICNESSLARGGIEVFLDGLPIKLPAERRSLPEIRAYLETLALEAQRILFSFIIDGERSHPSAPATREPPIIRIKAETIDLDDAPLRLIRTAMQQASHARAQLEKAITLVLINNGQVAREFWWNLARDLKEPLLTLSLVPERAFGPAAAGVSPRQLRRCQLQHLAAIIREVDQACWTEDTKILSNVLESQALPWLDNLRASLELGHETLLAASRAARWTS
jgi:hypothetical protein